jgi:hypothetical protein
MGRGAVQGNYENGLVYVIILFLTFWILFSYLVPISLFVTLEIVKFILVRPVMPLPLFHSLAYCSLGTPWFAQHWLPALFLIMIPLSFPWSIILGANTDAIVH